MCRDPGAAAAPRGPHATLDTRLLELASVHRSRWSLSWVRARQERGFKDATVLNVRATQPDSTASILYFILFYFFSFQQGTNNLVEERCIGSRERCRAIIDVSRSDGDLTGVTYGSVSQRD